MGPRARLIVLNILDAVLLNAAAILALLLRFDGRIPPAFLEGYLNAACFLTILGLGCLNLFQVNRTLWRYAGLPTALSLVNALTLAFLGFYFVNLWIRPQAMPRTAVILAWILSCCLDLGVRFAWKLLRGRNRHAGRSGRRVLIVGAGDVGAMVARELARTIHYPGRAIGFVDDDLRKQGACVEGLPVFGTTFDLPRLIGERRVGESSTLVRVINR